MKTWAYRFALALLVGIALPFLPSLLTQGVGPGADLSGHLALAGGVSAGTFAVLFAAGVLTSLTPCVYPLIPITVSVFGARQSEQRARSAALSATYVGGIAAMYSVLGQFAALSGEVFGSFLSAPWVIAVLAAFLVALAASMFGAFEIALPYSMQSAGSETLATTSYYTFCSMFSRERAQQNWQWLKKVAFAAPGSEVSSSASSNARQTCGASGGAVSAPSRSPAVLNQDPNRDAKRGRKTGGITR